MKQWTEKPLNNKRPNSQTLKTDSAPTVGNKVCDIEEHHRAITNRENTVSHHRLIVWQWLISDILHYPLGCHRETIKLQPWWIKQWRYTNIYLKQFRICTKYVLDDQSGGNIPEKSPSTDQRTHWTMKKYIKKIKYEYEPQDMFTWILFRDIRQYNRGRERISKRFKTHTRRSTAQVQCWSTVYDAGTINKPTLEQHPVLIGTTLQEKMSRPIDKT